MEQYPRLLLKKIYSSFQRNGNLVRFLQNCNVTADQFYEQMLPQVAEMEPESLHRHMHCLSGSKFASPVLRLDLTAAEIKAFSELMMTSTKAVKDQIANLHEDQLDTTNVLLRIQRLEQSSLSLNMSFRFANYCHPDAEVRKASQDASKAVSEFEVEQSMRVDVYEKVSRYAELVDRKTLTAEQNRLLDFIIRDYRREGLHLPEKKRLKLTENKKEQSSLALQFQTNISEESWSKKFSVEELEGLSEDWLESRKQEDGMYKVTLGYPCYTPLANQCSVEATRKLMDYEFNCRAKEKNVEIIEHLIQLRHEHAQILGYPTHAAFQLEVLMAKDPGAVSNFLEDLIEKTEPLANQDYEILLDYKKQDCEQRGLPFDEKINAWDFRYYHHLRLNREFKIDEEQVREYFPIENVTKNMLEVYEELLSVKFNVVEMEVWHDSVTAYEVADASSNRTMGHFFLDMHLRDGKYKHAAVFPLQSSCVLVTEDLKVSNERQTPMCAILCNFPASTATRPSLLSHNDVETFFHEFGHVMHNICSETALARFSGTKVERDFVEAPSQMLENWCWEKPILHRLSGRLSDGAPLPEELLDAMLSAKNATQGLFTRRQLTFGTMDQVMHTSPKCNTHQLWEKTTAAVSKIPCQEGTNMIASWGHLCGYDAKYYGYMWSKVFSSDMFATRFKEDPLSKQAGADYREAIISQGGTKDASEMMFNFLGRHPNSDAFLEELGLKKEQQRSKL